MSNQGLTVAEANNWLALEPHLLALIAQAVQGMSPAVHVLTSADLADVKESAQKTPAVHLIYGGYRIAEDLGTAWRLAHKWYAVVVVRNVALARSGQAARQDAGPMVAQVVGALVGASVPGATRRQRPARASCRWTERRPRSPQRLTFVLWPRPPRARGAFFCAINLWPAPLGELGLAARQ